MIRSMPGRAAALGVLAGAVLLLTACTPDATRGRVEHDFATTFSNQYAQSLQRQGRPAIRPKVTSTVCHSGTNLKADSGPGTWSCEIKYVGVDRRPHDDNWVELVDSLGCYQAFTQDDAKRFHKIVDVYSHKAILDPAGSFDGCFDVYDGRTDVTRK